MKNCVTILIIMCIPLIGKSDLSETELSGFYNAKLVRANTENNIKMGVFELAATGQISNRFSYEGVVGFEDNQSAIEGFLRTKIRDNLHLDFGKFDIPFGYEYSIADPVVNRFSNLSMMTDSLLNGVWTDEAINLRGDFSSLQLNLFWVNSTQSQSSMGFQGIVSLNEILSIGGSYARKTNLDLTNNNYRYNLFCTFRTANLDISTEYTYEQLKFHSTSPTGQGYKLSGSYYIKPNIYLSSRISQVFIHNRTNADEFAVGTGYILKGDNLIKLFYSRQNNTNSIILETAINFNLSEF